jgi:hypothetical protein
MTDKPTNNTRVTNNVMDNPLMRKIYKIQKSFGIYAINFPNYKRYAVEADKIYSDALQAGLRYMTLRGERKVSPPEVDNLRKNCVVDLENLGKILNLEIKIKNISINVNNTQYLEKANNIITNIFTESRKYRQDVLTKIGSKSKNNIFAQNKDVVIRNTFNEMITHEQTKLEEIIEEINYRIAQKKINTAYPSTQPAAGGKRKTRRAKKNTRSRK